MHAIVNDGNKKVVTFVGSPQSSGFSGAVTQISWENNDLRAALDKMFDLRPHEVITAIEISDIGIKAQFGNR